MIKTILIALKEARQIREYMAMADKGEFWQPVDGAGLVKFMVSTPGQKLRARLNSMVFKSALKACSADKNGDYERGLARGILLTVQAFDQHMDVARSPQEQDFVESSDASEDNSGVEQLALR